MRSPRRTYIEQIRQRGDGTDRVIDMTARVRVMRRGPSGVVPGELLPEAYGGLWDTWSHEYRGLGKPVEFQVHPGQVKLIRSFDEPHTRRTLSLGSQGGGKTEGLVIVAILLSLWHAGKYGGVVAPTRGRVKVVWRKILKALPAQWIRDIRPGDNEIHLKNGSVIQFFAAKKQAKSAGSPFAGNDWYWAVEEEQQDIDDESLEEVDARGRVNPDFQVFSGATNEPYGHFQRRVLEYEANASRKVVRFTGPENVFVHPQHWENLKANWSADAYRRKILCEDVPIEGTVYSAFSMKENVKTLPEGFVDITAEVTLAKYRKAYPYVVGVDFGMRVSAAVALKCYRAPAGYGWPRTDRIWLVVDELTTENRTTDWHAAAMIERFGDPSNFIAITGQDSNSKDPDRSDFVLFRKRGIQIVRANPGGVLSINHRYSMVNALLHAADGKRRLFIDRDKNGKARATSTVDSFQNLRLNSSDRAETYGKGTRGGDDLTHWTDCVGYALFPFEAFRGASSSKPRTESEE